MQQPDPQPTDPQARLRLTRHAALQKPALRSFTPFRTPKAGPNCTSGRKGSGRIFRRSKRQFAMRASSERCRLRCFPVTSFLSSIWDETAGYRSAAPWAYHRYSPSKIVRPVPEGIVESLIQNSDEANLALFSSGLTTGQSVRILSGPFANFVGQRERLDAAGRVRVLLDMMGTTVPVALRRSAICPAAA